MLVQIRVPSDLPATKARTSRARERRPHSCKLRVLHKIKEHGQTHGRISSAMKLGAPIAVEFLHIYFLHRQSAAGVVRAGQRSTGTNAQTRTMRVTPPTMSVSDSVYQQGRFQLSESFHWPRGLSPSRWLAATRKDRMKACWLRCEWLKWMTKRGGFVISACLVCGQSCFRLVLLVASLSLCLWKWLFSPPFFFTIAFLSTATSNLLPLTTDYYYSTSTSSMTIDN